MPRIITTAAKLKKTRKEGEKSCPFDLAVYNDTDEIIKLIETKFEHFFDDIQYNEKKKEFENKKIKATFNHEYRDKTFFINRYKARIENFTTTLPQTSF